MQSNVIVTVGTIQLVLTHPVDAQPDSDLWSRVQPDGLNLVVFFKLLLRGGGDHCWWGVHVHLDPKYENTGLYQDDYLLHSPWFLCCFPSSLHHRCFHWVCILLQNGSYLNLVWIIV